jgi:uncharacterized protein (TIGR04222 family)
MTWNPFDWTAGPFLMLYVTLAVVVFVLGFQMRSAIGPARLANHRLSALELAYLSGGARRVADAVLVSLMSGGGATIASSGYKITVTSQAPLAGLIDRPPPLAVQPSMTRQQFQAAVKPFVERIQQRLQQLCYFPTRNQMASFRMEVLPFVLLLLAFGTTKAFIGEGRHHPIGFLAILLVLTAVAGIALARRPTRTRAGTEALKTYRANNLRASRAPLDHELLLAVALSGAVVLSGTPYASVYAASQTMSSGSGCGGGSGCSGGGGGGGDGGGGCGGCS